MVQPMPSVRVGFKNDAETQPHEGEKTLTAQPPQTSRRVDRIHSLTAMRGLAALSVFGFHVSTTGVFANNDDVSDTIDVLMKPAGTVGVSFFFILSGFVLAWSSRAEDKYNTFVYRRIARVYPSHLVTFLIAMTIFAFETTQVFTAVLNLFLAQAWVPDPNIFLGVNGVTWSLSCELFFYLMFPFLIKILDSLTMRALMVTIVSILVLIFLLPVVAMILPEQPTFIAEVHGEPLAGQSIVQMWFVYIFTISRICEFILGISLGCVAKSTCKFAQWLPLFVTLLPISYVIGMFAPWTFTAVSVTVIPLAGIVVSLASKEIQETLQRLPRWIQSRPLRYFGDISYAFYLMHGIVISWMHSNLGKLNTSITGSVIFLLGALCLSFISAAALHHGIERPAFHLLTRKLPCKYK